MYQEQKGQRKCEKCPAKKYTYGKTGMTSQSNCSGRMTNQYKIGPLQLAITWLNSAMLESKLRSVMDKQRTGEMWGVTFTLHPSRILCLSTDASCEVCSPVWRYLTTSSPAAKGLFFKLVPLFSLQYANRADTCFPKIISFYRIDLGLRKRAYQKGRLIKAADAHASSAFVKWKVFCFSSLSSSVITCLSALSMARPTDITAVTS